MLRILSLFLRGAIPVQNSFQRSTSPFIITAQQTVIKLVTGSTAFLQLVSAHTQKQLDHLTSKRNTHYEQSQRTPEAPFLVTSLVSVCIWLARTCGQARVWTADVTTKTLLRTMRLVAIIFCQIPETYLIQKSQWLSFLPFRKGYMGERCFSSNFSLRLITSVLVYLKLRSPAWLSF